MEPFLIVGGVVGAAASVVALIRRHEKKRTAAFARFAEERGYSFQAEGPETLPATPELRLLTRGRRRRFSNFVQGTKDDATVFVGDYSYVSGSGKSSTRYQHTVCAVRSPALDLPRFFLRPQVPFLDALGKALGGQDLNFEDDPEFSRAFVLQSDADAPAVTRTFTRAVRAHFVALERRAFHLEAWGEWVLWSAPQRLDVKALEAVVVETVNLRRILAFDSSARQRGG